MKQSKPKTFYYYQEYEGKNLYVGKGDKELPNSTTAKPSSDQAEFVAGEWVTIVDERGVYYSKENGAQVNHVAFGKVPDHFTKTPMPSDCHSWDYDKKEWKHDLLKQHKKDIRIAKDSYKSLSSIEYKGSTFKCDDYAIDRLGAKVVQLDAGGAGGESLGWFSKDGTEVALTTSEMKELFYKLVEAREAEYVKYKKAKAASWAAVEKARV